MATERFEIRMLGTFSVNYAGREIVMQFLRRHSFYRCWRFMGRKEFPRQD